MNPDEFTIDIAVQAVKDRRIAITFTIPLDDIEYAAAYLFTDEASETIANSLLEAMQ